MEITKCHVSCVFRNSPWSIHGDIWAASHRDFGPRKHSDGMIIALVRITLVMITLVSIAAAYSEVQAPPKGIHTKDHLPPVVPGQ